MLTTIRDCKRGGEHFAIPTLGEIEGRLIVSETVAISCLRQLLADADPEVLNVIRRRIRRMSHDHCKKAKLCNEDTDAAVQYALRLLDAATRTAEERRAISTT